MRLPDFWTGLLFAALGVAIAVYATTFRVPAGAASPRIFPIVIGSIMVLAGVLIAIRGLKDIGAFESHEWMKSPRRIALVCYIPVAVIAFILLAPSLGTIFMAIIIVTVHAFIYGLRLLPAIAVGLVAGVGIPLIFVNILSVPLPVGIIEGLI